MVETRSPSLCAVLSIPKGIIVSKVALALGGTVAGDALAYVIRSMGIEREDGEPYYSAR
jgi:hypothetical protein